MKISSEIEVWAITILERVQAGCYREDTLVELKREITDPSKAARRIAAHCNVCRGETVLWIIGVDEIDGVVGWNPPDFATFLPQIWKCFCDEAPRCIPVSVRYGARECTALGIVAERPPYLVRNPHYGKEKGHAIEWEIPWRENTSVRSARRDEVIRLLLEHSLAPEIEIFECQVEELGRSEQNDELPPKTVQVQVHVDFYVMLRDERQLEIPFHRISGELSDHGNEARSTVFTGFRFSTERDRIRSTQRMRAQLSRRFTPANEEEYSAVIDTGSEVIIRQATRLDLYASTTFPQEVFDAWDQFNLEIVLHAGPERVAIPLSSDDVTKSSKNGR